MIVIPIGLLYMFANPLGKIPDEDQHARKSMAISNGIFFAHFNEDHKPYDKFNSKIHELVTRHTSSYEEAWNRVSAAETDEEIYLVYSMATYAPICHMPQAIGMFISRILGGGVSVQCYVARFTNMMVAIFIMYNAIKYIPFKKTIVFFLGLLPITISEFASMSSDALAISSCIFYISYILYLKYDKNKEKIEKKDVAILTISSIVVSLCKIVYIPLCVLLFTLPKEKFASKKQKNKIVITIFVVAVLLNIVWLAYASGMLVEANPGVNSGEQVKYIITHPISYALILFRTIHIYAQTFIVSLCGEGLGDYNVQAPPMFVFSTVLLFAFLFFTNDEPERDRFKISEKIIYTILFIIIVVLVYTSLYVAWTPLKTPIIMGVQTRYFLPVILLLAITFDNRKLTFNGKSINEYVSTFMMYLNLSALSCITYTYLYKFIIEYYLK